MTEPDPTLPTGEQPSSRTPVVSSREAVAIAAVVTLSTAAVVAYAFDPERAGMPSMLGAIGVLYAVLAAAAFYRLHQRGELRREMRPQSGDLTLGAGTAALLYGLAMAVHLTFTNRGSPREGWIMRLYLQLGDPNADSRILLGAVVFVIAALEEIVWRGLVMRSLSSRLGPERALGLTTLLFAAAHVPTCVLLADPVAGPNPLVVIAAAGCSLVWSYISIRTGRLVPSIFSHALFSWAIVEFPIWRP